MLHILWAVPPMNPNVYVIGINLQKKNNPQVQIPDF